ncbi:hypothetical protein ACFYXL_27205 [Streptomyces tsukubensis]|uniref:hypothetical protein n=1 Tax=Streptomyces tsukubensis TaxID=83656 RepID=UPI0036CE7292
MTEVSTEPVVAPPAAAAPNPPAPAQPEPTQQQIPAVAHTAGGWPVVPLALTGANATTALLAGAALAGGPVAAMAAATGAAVLGATAAHRRGSKKARPKLKAPAKGLRAAGKPSGGRVPSQPRRGSTGGKAAGSSATRTGKAGSGGAAANGRRRTAPAPASASALKSGKRPGRVGEVRALRQEARTASPSRAERRAGTTSARRRVADARRAAKQQARTTPTAARGLVGRAVARGTNAAGKARSAAAGRLRRARDEQAAATVAGQRSDVRRAGARRQARSALRRSAARFHGRRLLAALLAGALGIVGAVSTPLGRWLGWQWLQHPGRRLYARLVNNAHGERAARDRAIAEEREADERAAEAEAVQDNEQIGDRAERPGGPVPTTTSSDTTERGSGMSGFNFEEHAAEMEAAAHTYEPESAMEILAMVEGLPAALTSIANVMRILAERSDSEFPLEKEVADSFSDMFGALMSTVAVAEDMGPVFRKAHEQDIARHEDPRNGPEAEKGWNV